MLGLTIKGGGAHTSAALWLGSSAPLIAAREARRHFGVDTRKPAPRCCRTRTHPSPQARSRLTAYIPKRARSSEASVSRSGDQRDLDKPRRAISHRVRVASAECRYRRPHGAALAVLEGETPSSSVSELSAPAWRTKALCARPRGAILPDADDVDLLSSPEHWMCASCWRILAGWLRRHRSRARTR